VSWSVEEFEREREETNAKSLSEFLTSISCMVVETRRSIQNESGIRNHCRFFTLHCCCSHSNNLSLSVCLSFCLSSATHTSLLRWGRERNNG
jgi:hypothetical protein